MSLTKKDYEIIAGVLRQYTQSAMGNNIAVILADNFEQVNPKFDRNKFLTACGIEEKPLRGNTVYRADGSEFTLQ